MISGMNWYIRGSESPHSGGRGNWTDTAQICLNGHLINAASEYSTIKNKKHCSDCGEPTTTTCPECSAKIPGKIHYVNVIGGSNYKVPAFCSECGKAYPWTKQKIAAAKELASEVEGITSDQVQLLEESIVQISQDNPQAQVGATRINKIMKSVTGATGEILHKLIVDIASETAKKVLTGQ